MSGGSQINLDRTPAITIATGVPRACHGIKDCSVVIGLQQPSRSAFEMAPIFGDSELRCLMNGVARGNLAHLQRPDSCGRFPRSFFDSADHQNPKLPSAEINYQRSECSRSS